jgi:hypothetical protein
MNWHGHSRMLKLIVRTTLSITLGFVCTVLLFLLLHYCSEDPFSNSIRCRFLGRVYFWPEVFGPLAGLDCPNADLIRDKLTCAGIAFAVNIFTYSAVSFGVLAVFQRRRRRASLT